MFLFIKEIPFYLSPDSGGGSVERTKPPAEGTILDFFSGRVLLRELVPQVGVTDIPSFADLYPNEPIPRKIDPEYAAYVKAALGMKDGSVALMLGDTKSDRIVADNLRDRSGVNSFCVLVSPKLLNEYLKKNNLERAGESPTVFYDNSTQTWISDSWEAALSEVKREDSPFIKAARSRKNESGESPQLLCDLDKTFLNPEDITFEGDEKPSSDYISRARTEAGSIFAEKYLFLGMDEPARKDALHQWKTIYRQVKETPYAKVWDDEDTNALLTAFLYFGLVDQESLIGEMPEGLTMRTYLEKKLNEIASHKLEPEDIRSGALTKFKDIAAIVLGNIRDNYITPFELFRLEEYGVLAGFASETKLVLNSKIIAFMQELKDSLQAVSTILSDKPGASLGHPRNDQLKTKDLNSLLSLTLPTS